MKLGAMQAKHIDRKRPLSPPHLAKLLEAHATHSLSNLAVRLRSSVHVLGDAVGGHLLIDATATRLEISIDALAAKADAS